MMLEIELRIRAISIISGPSIAHSFSALYLLVDFEEHPELYLAPVIVCHAIMPIVKANGAPIMSML